MRRILAVLLAAFISGPMCLCLATGDAAPQDGRDASCCSMAQDHSLPAKAPAPTCGCNKCLAKRTVADGLVQLPAIAWAAAAPMLFEWSHHWSAFRQSMPVHSVITDTGPPHESRAELMRHGALLL